MGVLAVFDILEVQKEAQKCKVSNNLKSCHTLCAAIQMTAKSKVHVLYTNSFKNFLLCCATLLLVVWQCEM